MKRNDKWNEEFVGVVVTFLRFLSPTIFRSRGLFLSCLVLSYLVRVFFETNYRAHVRNRCAVVWHAMVCVVQGGERECVGENPFHTAVLPLCAHTHTP